MWRCPRHVTLTRDSRPAGVCSAEFTFPPDTLLRIGVKFLFLFRRIFPPSLLPSPSSPSSQATRNVKLNRYSL